MKKNSLLSNWYCTTVTIIGTVGDFVVVAAIVIVLTEVVSAGKE